jgi:hypothetical protein
MVDSLLDEEGLAVVRRAYARQMLGITNVRNDRLEQAFATIRCEDFLGPELWQIVQWSRGLARLGVAKNKNAVRSLGRPCARLEESRVHQRRRGALQRCCRTSRS